MSERVNLGKSAPALYQTVLELERLASEALAAAGIAKGFSHLLRLPVANPVTVLLLLLHGKKRHTSLPKSVLHWSWLRQLH